MRRSFGKQRAAFGKYNIPQLVTAASRVLFVVEIEISNFESNQPHPMARKKSRQQMNKHLPLAGLPKLRRHRTAQSSFIQDARRRES